VEHFGQRKQVGWVGEEVAAAVGGAWMGGEQALTEG